ncbi:MAG: SPOR domain-containing protein [Woeseia sp.]|nr:SPOR domain-containing protein [Woeseia sp.]NNE60774.1 SPOR domain-containing protein [Woeseia sp.]NNL55378.1 SPOR domain-containing protein [Woeseia sp.]
MTRKRKRRAARKPLPGWLWMLFGLAIGLAVALAVFLRDPSAPGQPQAASQPAARQAPAASASMLDDNNEAQAPAEPLEKRFDFYDMLPNFEVIIPEQETDVVTDRQPQAVIEPGVYILQAGSFSKHEDADRRRAELALQGIESSIQRVAIDDRTYHRVRIGPISDLNELNLLRSRLRQAKIDALRIRVPE